MPNKKKGVRGCVCEGDKVCPPCRRNKVASEWQKRNRDRASANKQAWRAANPGREQTPATKASDRLRRAGHTPAYFQAALKSQEDCCANPVCRKPFDFAQPRQGGYADHCHTTGLPRGVLCPRCNIALGYIEHPTFAGLLTYKDQWDSEHQRQIAEKAEAAE